MEMSQGWEMSSIQVRRAVHYYFYAKIAGSAQAVAPVAVLHFSVKLPQDHLVLIEFLNHGGFLMAQREKKKKHFWRMRSLY